MVKKKNKEKQGDNIYQKIDMFVKEIGNRPLTAEQQRIFKAFTRTKGHPSKFQVTDKAGRTFSFVIDPAKRNDGPQHVLKKHYRASIGRVTAIEIINMIDVIREGEQGESDKTHIVYFLKKKRQGVTYTFCLKIVKRGGVFKSFYSDRK